MCQWYFHLINHIEEIPLTSTFLPFPALKLHWIGRYCFIWRDGSDKIGPLGHQRIEPRKVEQSNNTDTEHNNIYDEEQSLMASLEQHIIHLEGEKKYQCKICSDTSPSKNILLEHVETNHFANTVSYHCPTCGKNFGTFAAFRGHTYDEKHRNQY